MRYNRDNVSVLVILDKRRAKKSGLFPVKIEVIFRLTCKVPCLSYPKIL